MINKKRLFKITAGFLCLVIALTHLFSPYAAYAQSAVTPSALFLPHSPGSLVGSSLVFNPIVLCGLKINDQNPFELDFMIDLGDSALGQDMVENEIKKLVKYFLVSLTTPQENLWVNLSPYEQDRIIDETFGKTEIGRDLLAQDYLLKKITASLIYPENDLGRLFWQRLYQKVYLEYGTTEIPVDAFNKVWIVPEKAVVYESEQGVFVSESRLKVLIEEDYLALTKHAESSKTNSNAAKPTKEMHHQNKIASSIIKEIVIPEIEQEVNHGKNFAQLRQIFHSLILATWFKRNLKNSIINLFYSNQEKIGQLTMEDDEAINNIYRSYLKTFEKGVFNYIKVEKDELSNKRIPRKYFSGGFFLSDSSDWLKSKPVKNIDRASTSSSIIKNSLLAKVHLIPTNSRSSRYPKPSLKKWKKYLAAFAFGIILSTSLPYSNLFAAPTNVIIGSKHGHKIEMSEDGKRFVVVDGEWKSQPDPAKYTYSGIAADVLANADELGIQVDQKAKIYWDIIERIAAINQAQSPEYTLYANDTIYLPSDILSLTKTEQTKIEDQVQSHQIQSKKIETQIQAPINANTPPTHIGSTGSGGPKNPKQESVIPGHQSIADPTILHSSDPDNENFSLDDAYSNLLQQINLQQIELDSLSQQIDALQKSIEELSKDSPNVHQSLIQELERQLQDLQNRKSRLQWSVERKFETELKMKADENYWVGKGGDVVLGLKTYTGLGDLSIKAKLKHNGSLRYGKEGQKTDLQRQLTVRFDNVFGSPWWISGELNWDNFANPYGLGIGVKSIKFPPDKNFSITPQIWHYSANTLANVSSENISVTTNALQSSYLASINLSYQFDNHRSLSLNSEGFFTKGLYTQGSIRDAQFTLSYKDHGWNIGLVRGFQHPSQIKDLTRLSQEPGPYRFHLAKTWSMNSQRIGLSGYWAFDDALKTTGSKFYVSLSGPLDFQSWKETRPLDKYLGLSFSSTTDILKSSDLFYNTNTETMAVGSFSLGTNIGDLYIGVASNYAVEGPSADNLTGYFSNPAFEAEYMIALDSEEVDNIHLGWRNGYLGAGIGLAPTSLGNLTIGPIDARLWHLPTGIDGSGSKKIIPQIQPSLSYRLANELFLNVDPDIIYSEGAFSIAGSVSLLYENMGFELATPFNLQNQAARQMGYLPYPYAYRAGPLIHFQNFSSGVYYGKSPDGNNLFGASLRYQINPKRQKTKIHPPQMNDKLLPVTGSPPPDPKANNGSTDQAQASSVLILNRENLFGPQNSSLWENFKRKINSQSVRYIYLIGSPGEILSSLQQELKIIPSDTIVYLGLEILESSEYKRHVALVDTALALKKSTDTYFLQILEGQKNSTNDYLFYMELQQDLLLETFSLGLFYLKQAFPINQLQRNGFGSQIFKNFAEMLQQKFPTYSIWTYDFSKNGWTERRFHEHFFSVTVETEDIQEFDLTINKISAFIASEEQAIQSSSPVRKGGIDLTDSSFLASFDSSNKDKLLINSFENANLNSIEGFFPIIISIVPLVQWSASTFLNTP